MTEKKLRGVPMEVLGEIAGSLRKGQVVLIDGSPHISFEGKKQWPSGLIPVSRMGICPQPDPLGPGTTDKRLGGIKKGLQYLKAVEERVRKQAP